MRNKLMIKTAIMLVTILILQCSQTSKYEFPFQDPNLDFETRASDLISRMTLEEKVSQLVYNSPAIERLGIPSYNWWNECLHGVARAGLATVFPQAIGMAATFDTSQMVHMASVISDEARAKYNKAVSRNERGIYQGLTFWTPNINIFRDPRWGRGMETYGEDPFLTGSLAVPFIKTLQGNHPKYLKTIATSKHFVVHSGPEPTRHEFDAIVSPKDYNETYLPHFKRTVQEANVQSVMCAYNRLDGEPCCGSGKLLNNLLRDEWGFDGYVVSDCWALTDFFSGHNVSETGVDAAALAITSGTDLNCGVVFENLNQSIQEGLISEHDIDIALKRLFIARFKLGMFDPDETVPYSKIPYDIVACKKHADIAHEVTLKSMVLLKNDGLLPLSKEYKHIAVIGPNADDEDVLLGNYNGYPSNPITPLTGIKNKVGPETEVSYARGCNHAENLPFTTTIPEGFFFLDSSLTKPGIKAEYYNNIELKGNPLKEDVQTNLDVNWWDEAPFEGMKYDSFAVRWTGYLAPKISGEYKIGGQGQTGFNIIFNTRDTITGFNIHSDRLAHKVFHLEAGKSYPIVVEYFNLERMAKMKLIWETPKTDLATEAVNVVKKSDLAILFMGLSPKLEGEEMKVEVPGFKGGDRITLGLPKVQQELIKKTKKTGKPVVLVLLNGSALAINWEKENIPSILEAWYPGQDAGTAIADILFGDYNPAGRLPVTFYKSADELPPFEDYSMQDRTYKFFNGEALFEFGYGLSYTTFEYSNLTITNNAQTNDTLIVSIDIKNTGDMAGDEVAQLYISSNHIFGSPIRSLQGFTRLHLKPDEEKTVKFMLTPIQLASYNEEGIPIVFSGNYTVSVGGKQPGKVPAPNVQIKTIKLTGNDFLVN